ncbi:MAG TPA: diacylglycerol kinase family protein [Candidatus Sulfotelmatobacter sp.]|jgi:diacylglycerol kinase family enzyme
MRKAALLYNPDSGGSHQRRRELESALALLRVAGVDAELVPTESTRHGVEETRRAIECGCDTIFACGGDGTIHNIAQVVAHSPAALAILPLGTANALAHDIQLPLKVVEAAQASLHAVPRRIPLGRVNFADLNGNPGSRYFLVAAGIGADAHLFYKLHTGTKQRMGMGAYYAKAWQLWFNYPMTRFVAEYMEAGSDSIHRAEVTELMAVRIRNFGGVLQELAPGASLDRNDNRLVFCRTASRLAYLAYVTRGLLRLRCSVPGIDLAHSTSVACTYMPQRNSSRTPRRIYVEADGELLGTLPAEISVVPDALTLLMPPRANYFASSL